MKASGKEFAPEVARRLAGRFQREPADFRYIELHYFDGQQWTVSQQWQIKNGGHWENVDWTEIQF